MPYVKRTVKVMPLVDGLDGLNAQQQPVVLSRGVPGWMYVDEYQEAVKAKTVVGMVGQTPQAIQAILEKTDGAPKAKPRKPKPAVKPEPAPEPEPEPVTEDTPVEKTETATRDLTAEEPDDEAEKSEPESAPAENAPKPRRKKYARRDLTAEKT